jgi:hypothetical protein
MKTRNFIALLILALILAGKGYSQSSTITVFSEKGEKFSLYINGNLKNDAPDKHVRADVPGGPTFKIMVELKDVKVPAISKTVFNKPATDFFYVVHQNAKGVYVLDHTSSDIGATEEAAKEETPPPPPPEHEKSADQKADQPAKKATGGCTTPMNEPDFQASLVMISNAPFESPKLSQAKKMVESHCLTCRQITEVMYTVSNESSRLTIAKSAYTHCYDPDSYDDVKDVLRSDKSKADLDKYIASVK